MDYIFAILSEAFAEIAGSKYNLNQDQVLPLQINDPYPSDKEVGDDNIGLAGKLNLPADVTMDVDLHQHDSESEDEEQVQEKKRQVTKESWEIEQKPLRMTGLVKKKSCNPFEDFPQILNITKLELYSNSISSLY